ncbi:hypothetical protein PHISCL_09620, partial [Aspergillus sclerotialis]
ADMHTQDTPERQYSSNTSIIPQDDNRGSLHSLYSGLDTDCERGALGLAEQNIQYREDIQDSSHRDNTPSCFSPTEIFPTDQDAFSKPLEGCDTLGKGHFNQQGLNENGLESGDVNVQSAPSYENEMQTSNCEGYHSLEGKF